jgi:hypothetical protein
LHSKRSSKHLSNLFDKHFIFSRKLEEAVNNLQKFSLELAQKRKQIQTMIAEFLPPSVMEEMQSTDGTPAGNQI